MSIKASFCYQTVTHESAEQGDYSEQGWITPGMWEFPLQDDNGHHNDVLEQAQSGDFDVTNLSEIVSFAQSLGISENSGNWLSSVDPDIDYQTGEDTTYSLHIEGVTPATYNRIARLITGES